MWKRYIPSLASFLFASGLQVSGYQNPYVASFLFALGGILLIYAAWPKLKIRSWRSKSVTSALFNDPHVILSCDATKPRTWHLSSSNASAFNVTSDPIGTSDLYALVDIIHEIKASESVGIKFLVHDKKNQIENHPLLWLENIFDYSASKAYPVCVHYKDAGGQNFRSEAMIVWDGPKEEIRIIHERILRVSS